MAATTPDVASVLEQMNIKDSKLLPEKPNPWEKHFSFSTVKHQTLRTWNESMRMNKKPHKTNRRQ